MRWSAFSVPVLFFLVVVILLHNLAIMGASPTKHFGEESSKIISKVVTAKAGGKTEYATFAAGCFWGIELAFQRVPGVVETAVGYTAGSKKNPTYEEVCSGSTGHTEAVQLIFDPALITYEELLTVLWDIHDPTTLNRQGGDTGTQYRSGIYYHSEEQRRVAFSSREVEQTKHLKPIVTEILEATTFYKAEEYHQQYLLKGGQCASKGSLSPIRCYG